MKLVLSYDFRKICGPYKWAPVYFDFCGHRGSGSKMQTFCGLFSLHNLASLPCPSLHLIVLPFIFHPPHPQHTYNDLDTVPSDVI